MKVKTTKNIIKPSTICNTTKTTNCGTNYNYNFNNKYNYNTATTTNKTITTTNANFETYSKDVHPPHLEASHTIHNELLFKFEYTMNFNLKVHIHI